MIPHKEINQKAWELAIVAIVDDRGRLKPYSNKQIRKMLEVIKFPDFKAHIKGITEKYTPPINRSGRTENWRKRYNKEFGDALLNALKDKNDRDREFAQRLLQYVLWDLYIIENYITKSKIKLELCLDCEQVSDKKIILQMFQNRLKRRSVFDGIKR